MMKLFSERERRLWKRSFWIMVLFPPASGVLLYAYVSILKAAHLCVQFEGWPPPCVAGNMNLTGYVGAYITTLTVGWVFLEAFICITWFVMVSLRMGYLKLCGARA